MRVGIIGAGAIGTFVAARLSASGAEVVLIGSRPSRDRIRALDVTGRRHTAGLDLVATTEVAALGGVDVCLVAVKSNATDRVARSLAEVLPKEAPVVSLQNGLRNVARLRARLGDRAVGGVVTYNVFLDDGCARQASKGVIFAGMRGDIAGHRLRQLRAALRRGGETLVLRDDIEAAIAGKLLLNLNNGICAATGLSISASLRARDARWCFAACLSEGLRVMRAAEVTPARVTLVPPRLIAALMGLPDELVLRLAQIIANVDPRARSSTLQDLDRGRETEIEELNGAIVWLARSAGISAPANRAVTRIVHEHEAQAAGGATPRYLAPALLRARIEAALI